MNIHRENQWQLELARNQATIRRLIDEKYQAGVDLIHAHDELRQALESLELARRVAVRLEQENHALAGAVCSLCAKEIVPVHYVGEAR